MSDVGEDVAALGDSTAPLDVGHDGGNMMADGNALSLDRLPDEVLIVHLVAETQRNVCVRGDGPVLCAGHA